MNHLIKNKDTADFMDEALSLIEQNPVELHLDPYSSDPHMDYERIEYRASERLNVWARWDGGGPHGEGAGWDYGAQIYEYINGVKAGDGRGLSTYMNDREKQEALKYIGVAIESKYLQDTPEESRTYRFMANPASEYCHCGSVLYLRKGEQKQILDGLAAYKRDKLQKS